MPRRRIAAVINFEPELMQFWLDAINGPQAVKLPTHANVVRLRHKLYSLRASMRAENHPATPALEGITLRIEEQPDGRWAVIGGSGGSEFKEAFAEAGIVVPEPPSLKELLGDAEPSGYYTPDYKVKEDK